MRAFCVIAVSVCLGTGVLASPSFQRLGMMRAEWTDLQTWSHYDEGARENELGLGLHLAGPSGMTFMAFTGRLPIRTPIAAPREIGVQVAIGKFSNPNQVRRAALMFVADPGTDDVFRLDLSDRLNVDDPVPGGGVENGTAMIRTSDFVRIANATKLAADILGFDATFRDDQLSAIRQFGERLRVIAPK